MAPPPVRSGQPVTTTKTVVSVCVRVLLVLYSTLLYSTLLYSTPLHSTPLHSNPLESVSLQVDSSLFAICNIPRVEVRASLARATRDDTAVRVASRIGPLSTTGKSPPPAPPANHLVVELPREGDAEGAARFGRAGVWDLEVPREDD